MIVLQKKTISLILLITLFLLLSQCGETQKKNVELPPITLLGEIVDTVYLNTQYKTANPAAIIDVEGSRREDIKVTGSVNTTVPGTYYLDYDYSDVSGNRAATVTRTVHVVMSSSDSIKIKETFAMFNSIGISLQWNSTENIPQQVSIKTSTEPLIYLEYQNRSQVLIYTINEVQHHEDALRLKTTSHFGDTLCFWIFKPLGKSQGYWSTYKPLKKEKKELGRFTALDAPGQ